MERDDARLQDARAWLVKAELDLRAATHDRRLLRKGCGEM